MKEQDEQQFREQTRHDPAGGIESEPVGQASADNTASSVVDAVAESASGPDGSPAASDPAELHMLLEDARSKADETQDQLLRVRAEMENMKRRQSKELENAHKFALDGFVKELLLVRDSLELGYAAAVEPDADLVKLREGTELTLKQLGDVMSKFGVERIDPEGDLDIGVS